MKVILNKDLPTLGEEGDVKDVAKGYFRNYLHPRGIALPYNSQTIKLFEARKDRIEARKAEKRQDALGLKEKLEGLELEITMPAGANGRLYGAVTTQTIMDELARKGFQVDRKRIDLAGTGIKNAGKYKAVIKLYENSQAEIQFTIIGQEIKTETPQAPARPARRRREFDAPASAETSTEASIEASVDTAPNESGAVTEASASAAAEIPAASEAEEPSAGETQATP